MGIHLFPTLMCSCVYCSDFFLCVLVKSEYKCTRPMSELPDHLGVPIHAHMRAYRNTDTYASRLYLIPLHTGHLIHIDYGFIFDISPGRNMRFESAGFKLTYEMVELICTSPASLAPLATAGAAAATATAVPSSSSSSSFASGSASSGSAPNPSFPSTGQDGFDFDEDVDLGSSFASANMLNTPNHRHRPQSSRKRSSTRRGSRGADYSTRAGSSSSALLNRIQTSQQALDESMRTSRVVARSILTQSPNYKLFVSLITKGFLKVRKHREVSDQLHMRRCICIHEYGIH